MTATVDRVTSALALLGGVLILVTGLLVTASVLSRWLTSQGISGDFDLVQLALAMAVFAFLPICQWRRANIIVDTFTANLPPRMRRGLDALWSLVYAGIAATITWGMAAATMEAVASGTTTMMLGLPIAWAMGAATVFAAWLVVVTLALALGPPRPPVP